MPPSLSGRGCASTRAGEGARGTRGGIFIVKMPYFEMLPKQLAYIKRRGSLQRHLFSGEASRKRYSTIKLPVHSGWSGALPSSNISRHFSSVRRSLMGHENS